MDSDGLIKVASADEARFDHKYENGVIKSLGLLVEESRSNIFPYSVVSTTAGWSINSSTLTNNATTAPDGTNTAARVQVDTANGYVARLSIPVSAGTTYTLSFWLKSVSGSGTWGINIYDHGGANIGHHRTTVNITEEWQRVSYTYTPTGTQVNVYVSDDRESLATISDGYVWGAQLEAGSFMTSLIPTSGGTATRNPDSVSMTGDNFSDWYNPSEGTIYATFKCDNWNSSNQYGKVFTINQAIFGVENNGFWIGNDANNSNTVRYRVRSGGVNQFGPANLTRTSTTVKSAMSVKSSDFAITIDGNTPTTSISGTLPQVMNSLTIGRDIFGIEDKFLNGTISKLTYYPTRLSNDQLQNLTK
jgi:hypothetical protein